MFFRRKSRQSIRWVFFGFSIFRPFLTISADLEDSKMKPLKIDPGSVKSLKNATFCGMSGYPCANAKILVLFFDFSKVHLSKHISPTSKNVEFLNRFIVMHKMSASWKNNICQKYQEIQIVNRTTINFGCFVVPIRNKNIQKCSLTHKIC